MPTRDANRVAAIFSAHDAPIVQKRLRLVWVAADGDHSRQGNTSSVGSTCCGCISPQTNPLSSAMKVGADARVLVSMGWAGSGVTNDPSLSV